MHRAVEQFLDEIRKAPKFAAAAARDPKPGGDLEGLRRVFETLHCSDEAVAIRCFDRLTAAISDKSQPIKARVLAVQAILIDTAQRMGIRG